MIEMTVEEIARACGGDVTSGMSDMATFTSVTTDSRTVEPGDLFYAFRGPTYDGHDFIAEAIDKGAMGIIAEKGATNPFIKDIPELYIHVTLILVDDTLKAFQQTARVACRKIGAKVVAVTGSTGKTTTKDMITAVLKRIGKTAATAENNNNEYGLPATILQADPDVDYMVLEMGMRGPGQIADLVYIAKPLIGVITNVGLSHYELMGSVESIAAAKAELAEGVRKQGTVIVNADDPWSDILSTRAVARVLTFGLEKPAAVTAVNVTVDEMAKPSFTVKAKIDEVGSEFPVKLAYPGVHNVYNALAAAAVCLVLNVSPDDIAKGLAEADLTKNRMDIIMSTSGAIILNDTYNANPTSVAAALAALRDVKGTRKIAVLGDMLELGEMTAQAHGEIGRICFESGIDMLVAAGAAARSIAGGAKEAGMRDEAVIYYAVPDDAVAWMKDEIKAGDVVLVKASRDLAFERIVACIK